MCTRKEHAKGELATPAEVPFRGLLHALLRFLAKLGVSEARAVGESQHGLGLPPHARRAAALAVRGAKKPVMQVTAWKGVR